MLWCPANRAGPDTVSTFGGHIGGCQASQMAMSGWAVNKGPLFAVPQGKAPSGAIHRCPPPSLQLLLHLWLSGYWARGTGNLPVLCTCPLWRGDNASECFKQVKAWGDPAKGETVQWVALGARCRCGLPGDTGHHHTGGLSRLEMPQDAHGARVKVEELVSTKTCLGKAGGK